MPIDPETSWCKRHRCFAALCEDQHERMHSLATPERLEVISRILDEEAWSFNGPSTPGEPIPDNREFYLMITRNGPGFDVDGEGDPLVPEPGPK